MRAIRVGGVVLGAAFALTPVMLLRAETLYVSTAGRTDWSGNLPGPNAQGTDGPLPSLPAARDRIRQLRRGGTSGAMTVLVRGATYFLTDSFLLTPEDSSVTYAAYPAEHPILSGGRRIEGWKKGTGPLWTAPAPVVFRQMFVGGRRAQRARTPNKGFYRIDGRIVQDRPFVFKFRGNDIRTPWAERGDVEVVAIPAWQEARAAIVEVDEAAHTARLAGNAPLPAGRNQQDVCYWIENAPNVLDSPGEWYLDRQAGTVSYWPLSGEDMTAEEVIAPAVVQLVRLEGTPESGNLVRNIVFRALEFRHADWSMGPRGYTGMQAAANVPAAIEATGAENVSLENCRFTQSGGYAIWFGRGSKGNKVLATEISDMGAGGVKLGEPLKDRQRENEAERNSGNVIADNNIHNLGLVYPAGVGIWLGQSSDNKISHNHVHDLFYSAISMGWTWFYKRDQSQGNIIEYNHLHNIGQNVMSDMGGVYTLGEQPGTVIRNNLIHDVSAFVYGGWDIYLDQASSEIVVENNIIYNCRSASFNQNFGRENVIRNNIFAFGKEYQMTRARSEPHRSFTFERNIVYFDQGKLLGNNWQDGLFMNRNIYWDTRGFEIRPAGRSWQQWQESGRDKESLIADPLFADPASFDFSLTPQSPAWKLGFQPVDTKGVGPRVPAGPAGLNKQNSARGASR